MTIKAIILSVRVSFLKPEFAERTVRARPTALSWQGFPFTPSSRG